MQFPGTFARRWQTLISHYRQFGPEGVRFLFRKRKPGNQLIAMRMKGFENPLWMRNHTTDIPMFYHIFSQLDYDFAFPYPPKIILDCGAHIGLSAIYFAKKYPSARIICIEADASNYAMLVRNTNAYPQITAIHAAIWNTPEPVQVKDVDLGNWGYMVEPHSADAAQTVPGITIDELMARFNISHIDICKINIEGSEKELFEKNYHHWVSRTSLIAIELHDRMRKGCSKAVFRALQEFDFELSWKAYSLLITLHHPAA